MKKPKTLNNREEISIRIRNLEEKVQLYMAEVEGEGPQDPETSTPGFYNQPSSEKNNGRFREMWGLQRRL